MNIMELGAWVFDMNKDLFEPTRLAHLGEFIAGVDGLPAEMRHADAGGFQ